MNETLQATLGMVRTISISSQMKTKRNFADFLSDRLAQATSEPTLLAAIERLAKLVDANLGEIYQSIFTDFLKVCGGDDAQAALEWLREYPRVAAMLTMLKQSEYDEAIVPLDLPPSRQRGGVAIHAARHQVGITATCLSPLAHGADTKAGNATLFRRMQVLSTTGAVLTLPFYAGNAVRGQIRDLLADDLVDSLGLTPRRDKPPLALWFFHALYAGGVLEENSEAAKRIKAELGDNGSIKTKGIHEFRDTLPGLSLLGAALGNRILCGRAKFADLRPVCKQWGTGDTDLAQLFEWLYLTRREDHEEHTDHSGMIANTECLRAGTTLAGGVDLDCHANELERAALGRGLKLLKERGYLGAENRRGFGKVALSYENAPDPAPYETYLAEHQSAIIAYLERLGAICIP